MDSAGSKWEYVVVKFRQGDPAREREHGMCMLSGPASHSSWALWGIDVDELVAALNEVLASHRP
jgi:hypothetical protein